jgi:zinc transport system substrate-binding protein
MKKYWALLIALCLLLSTTACATPQVDDSKVNVATSAYALKYFIEQVGGAEINVNFSFTGSPHHVTLTQQDATRIAQAKALFNVEAGDYVELGNQLRNINQGMQVFDLSRDITLLRNEDIHEHEHEDDGKEGKGHDAGDEGNENTKILDPHIWLDPTKASALVANIARSLAELKPERSDYFMQNAQAVQAKLATLDDKFKTTLTPRHDAFILVNHAAYGYMAHRYDFSQKAIASSADHSENTQASTIALDEFVAAHDIHYVFIEPNTETNSMIDVLTNKYNLQQVTLFNIETPVDASADYFELMEQNLVNIKQALG